MPRPAVSAALPLQDVPHITILRPAKGLEPHLYECLASTFLQTYPKDKLTIYLCTSSRRDAAYSVFRSLLADYPAFDARILLEDEDPNLSGGGGEVHNLGPNPKIRNMSRGYREAKGDIVWMIDCNVWVGPGVAGRMVDLLCGFTPATQGVKYKFVHQLPLVVDISTSDPYPQFSSSASPIRGWGFGEYRAKFTSRADYGGLLEELFLSTAHAKFYTAISAVAIAPCIVGKSNMFRRSHLNALTSETTARPPGIDSFSDNICEDHLIGDLLWRSPVPLSVRLAAEREGTGSSSDRNPHSTTWRNHGLLPSDLAIQPTSHLSLNDYLARRVRWLRVRKFTVFLATLVEPGTESLLCSSYFAFGATTHPWITRTFSIPTTWLSFVLVWVLGVCGWMAVDYLVWSRLQGGRTIEGQGPAFLQGRKRRSVREWLLGWVGREALALGIWVWAVVGGGTVVWRGRKFWVGMNMKVHEIGGIDSNTTGGIDRHQLGGIDHHKPGEMQKKRTD